MQRKLQEEKLKKFKDAQVEYEEKLAKTERQKRQQRREMKIKNQSKTQKLLKCQSLKEEKLAKKIEDFKKRHAQEDE
jgi:NifU-like protein involved in Fe-S cluster formation